MKAQKQQSTTHNSRNDTWTIAGYEKILWEHRLNTKAQGMQMKAQKQQSITHNSKNDTWTIAGYEKSHQNIAGTQAKYEKKQRVQTQVQNQQSTSKYYAQSKNDTWTTAAYEQKSSKYCGHTS